MTRGIAAWTMLVVLCAAGTAMAQDVPETPPLANISIALAAMPSVEPIAPITEERTTSVNVTVTCEQGSVQTTPVTVSYQANLSHPMATVGMSKVAHPFEFTPEQCLQGHDLMDTVDVTVSFAHQALAGETATLVFTAQATDGEPEPLSWDHEVGPYFRHGANLEKNVWKEEPGATFGIPGTIQNLGNARVRFVFSELPDEARRLTLTMPEPLVVEPFGTDTFNVTVTIPSSDSFVDRRDNIQFRVQALLDADHTVEGEPVDLSAVVQTQGGAEESPGPVLPFLVVFVTAFAASRRRTRSTIRP